MLAPGQITQWLKRLREGDEAALEHLVPLLYDELRQLARRVFFAAIPDDPLSGREQLAEPGAVDGRDGDTAVAGGNRLADSRSQRRNRSTTSNARRPSCARPDPGSWDYGVDPG